MIILYFHLQPQFNMNYFHILHIMINIIKKEGLYQNKVNSSFVSTYNRKMDCCGTHFGSSFVLFSKVENAFQC